MKATESFVERAFESTLNKKFLAFCVENFN